jgi:hypothetical protein
MYACAEDYDRTAPSLSLILLGLAGLHRVHIWYRLSQFLGTERRKPVTWVNALKSSSITREGTSGGLLITDRGPWSLKRSPIQGLEEQHPPDARASIHVAVPIAHWHLGLHDAPRQNPMHNTAGSGKAERVVAAESHSSHAVALSSHGWRIGKRSVRNQVALTKLNQGRRNHELLSTQQKEKPWVPSTY